MTRRRFSRRFSRTPCTVRIGLRSCQVIARSRPTACTHTLHRTLCGLCKHTSACLHDRRTNCVRFTSECDLCADWCARKSRASREALPPLAGETLSPTQRHDPPCKNSHPISSSPTVNVICVKTFAKVEAPRSAWRPQGLRGGPKGLLFSLPHGDDDGCAPARLPVDVHLLQEGGQQIV